MKLESVKLRLMPGADELVTWLYSFLTKFSNLEAVPCFWKEKESPIWVPLDGAPAYQVPLMKKLHQLQASLRNS